MSESEKAVSKYSSDGAAIVDHNFHWKKITQDTPKRVKVQLVNITEGVADYGRITRFPHPFFTHWAPLPTFKDE